MFRLAVTLAGVGLLLLMMGSSCGRITLGNISPEPALMQEGAYFADSGQSAGVARYRAATLTPAQAQEYRVLQEELSDTLALYRQVDQPGYRKTWPVLDQQRIEQMRIRYGQASQLLSWRYDNIGDYNLDGTVNTTDLIPVAVLSQPDYSLDGRWPADTGSQEFRDWIDSDHDGQLGHYNAQLIGQSYGRMIFGYAVFAGMDNAIAQMDPIGVISLRDRLPGLPPAFELNVPANYTYTCIQALGPRQEPLCSYIVNMADMAVPVIVIQSVR